ncbi:MAG: apolipoprotein N-acyltransferase [Sphaerochaetaceae bacterium]|nr:apolipoprotein N-acyltransferase [Sphaerochaetaceae bacterium]MDD2406175.1 apolipoprotein N-acyltransferase [Sphaerochaetaceae bacterium]MDD3670353.1 apolipoprotein N-acyltransferase [Sphaerochaetaceae bacterium]MDD4258792.1 apolipoprotein N-acyltransferase [Sphaerochaetaceae bacterium]MDD4763624.1 apolipoprotein N-acyltransferase [Sphaerochaetaceae bacterium]
MNLYAKRGLKSYSLEILLLVLTAVVFSFAFPGFLSNRGIGAIAFVALIPLFAIIRNTGWAATPIYGFLFGFTFYSCFNYWLTTFHPLAILIVPIIKGGEMILLFPVLKAADKLFKRHGYLVQTCIWVAYTYLGQSWFAGYPYGTVGYAVYEFLPFIQIADLTGIWGINFIMILPQALLGRFVGDVLAKHNQHLKEFLKSYKITVISYAIVLVAIFIYGFVMIGKWNAKEPDKNWRVATVQHSADSWKGGYATYKRNFNTLRTLSLQALLKDPEMIIWSETAFVPSVYWHTTYRTDEETADLVEEFVNFGKSLPIPLLTGNPEGTVKDETLPPLLEDGSWNRMDYNTVIMFEDGQIKNTYRKQHLVPFTEHFPYEKQMPWLYNLLLANDYNWWEKGYDPVVFETSSGVTFSTPICFEDVFGYLTAGFVRNGAHVIVNMTNDSWSGAVSAEMQHLGMAVFRSVETRKSTVRGTNSGMTCVIEPTGKIVDPMEPFTKGFYIYDVPVYTSEDHTLYTTHDDWLAFMMIYISLGVLAIGSIKTAVVKIMEVRQKHKKS